MEEQKVEQAVETKENKPKEINLLELLIDILKEKRGDQKTKLVEAMA